MGQLVIYNNRSGKSDQMQLLHESLPRQTTRWLELTRDLDLVQSIEQEFSDQSRFGRGRCILAAGGDGTVNAVVNALMHIEPDVRPSLGIVPMGTANDFAFTLAIPDDVAAAARLSLEREPRPIDVACVRGSGSGRYFANVAAGGNCVRVTEEMTDELKSRWGAFSYLRGAVTVLSDMQSYRIDIDIDDERFRDFDSWALLVANGRTNAGHIEVAPLALPNDGLLDIVLFKDGTVADMAEIVAGNLIGNFLECDQIIFRQAKRVKLYSQPTMRFTLDGEVVNEEPVEFYVVPNAIKMFVGEEFKSSPPPR